MNKKLKKYFFLSIFFTIFITSLSINTQANDNNIIQKDLTLIDRANVAPDPDLSRKDFDDKIDNPIKPKNPTAVTIEADDQIKNLSSYKDESIKNSTYASVGSWADLKKVYADDSKKYIEITQDFSAPANVNVRDLGWRVTNLIIDGAGHTINMDRGAFNVGTSASVRGSIFTITDINIIHWQSGTNTGDSTAADGVIDSRSGTGGYGYWNFNINNVTLKGPDGPDGVANRQPRRLLDAEDSAVKLSGNVQFEGKQELMQIGQVDIVNGSYVKLERTTGSTGYSMFYFRSSPSSTSDTGNRSFSIGDDSTLIGNETRSGGTNYPLVYRGYNSITVGDNVNWSQDGFQMLLDLGRYSGSQQYDRLVTFGQNLKMTALKTVGSQSLTATNRAKITFNAGTILNLEQWNNSNVIQTDAGSTITFISPKSLHISRNNNSGNPTTGSLFSGAGTFSMNNSQIRTWANTSNEVENPAGDKTLKFANLSISGTTTTITDTGGQNITSDIITFGTRGTRELNTDAIDPGTIKINYVDQYGKTVTSVDYPIDKEVNYIGQYLQLQTKTYAFENMPENYMWAIAEQVPVSAKTDKQSGGDKTSIADDGDSYGQAEIAIVPMEGVEYNYNIYIYGNPNNDIQYEYKDLKSEQIIKSEFPNAGKEKAGTDLSPANYGNDIIWTDEYYTHTNVPPGYHYATSDELDANIQPTNTTVGLSPSLTTFFIYPDKQTVIVTLENADGSPLVNQESPISIDGYSGQKISYADLLVDKITENGVEAEQGEFIFDFTDNRGSTVDKTPQYITVKLVNVRVKMTIKQVYKTNHEQAIYQNIEKQEIVNNDNNSHEEIIGESISDVINKFKVDSKYKLKIDYDWYETLNEDDNYKSDYVVIVDGKEVNTDKIPDKDFDLLLVYTGITKLEVSDLDYGKIPISKNNNEIYDNPNKNQNVTVTNTDLSYNWNLDVSLENNEIQNIVTNESYLGGLLVEKNNQPNFITDQGYTFSKQSEQSNPLLSSIPMNIKLYQDTGNSLGNYKGNVLWTLKDVPNIP